MADESTPSGGEGQSIASASETTSAAPATPPPATASQPIGITSEVLKQRLDETREKTREAVLKDLGFPSVAEGKKALEALKKFQESQMSEQEKIAARVKQLEAFEKSAGEYQERYSKAVEREFNRLPEKVREAIDEQAGGDPKTREMLMGMFAKVGVSAGATATVNATDSSQSQAAAPQAPKPTTVAASQPAPKPTSQRSKLDEFTDMQKTRPMAAALFYQAHRIEIEAARNSQ